jgi:hypothetical protein
MALSLVDEQDHGENYACEILGGTMSSRRVLVVLFALLVPAVTAKAEPVIVQTSTGALAGNGGDIRVFKGIPFAAPPIG